jgi:hypothetical protein
MQVNREQADLPWERDADRNCIGTGFLLKMNDIVVLLRESHGSQALGDKNRAFEFLEKAYGNHEWVSLVKTPPDSLINNIAAFVSISVLLYLSAMFRFLGLRFGTLFRY